MNESEIVQRIGLTLEVSSGASGIYRCCHARKNILIESEALQNLPNRARQCICVFVCVGLSGKTHDGTDIRSLTEAPVDGRIVVGEGKRIYLAEGSGHRS